jgi:cytosine/adenosine deaminase-related metal-dependent hydrolase
MVAAVQREHRVPLHVHLSEQPAENHACLDATGLSPAALLAEAGLLTPATSVVHATHLGDDDIELLGRARVTVVACPTTEQDLGDGLGPFGELAAAGAVLATGTDSHAVIDPFAEMRGVELHDRLRRHVRGALPAGALLAAATAGGARSLALDTGVLAPGAPADLVTIGLDSLRLAGFDPDDLVPAVVFAAAAGDVSDVVVGGRRIVAARTHQALPDLVDRLGGTIRALVAGL